MSLFTSRRFWTLILDLVVSMVLYFVAKYAAPAAAEDVKFVIGSIQPVFLVLIAAYTHTDAVAINAGK